MSNQKQYSYNKDQKSLQLLGWFYACVILFMKSYFRNNFNSEVLLCLIYINLACIPNILFTLKIITNTNDTECQWYSLKCLLAYRYYITNCVFWKSYFIKTLHAGMNKMFKRSSW